MANPTFRVLLYFAISFLRDILDRIIPRAAPARSKGPLGSNYGRSL